MIAEIGHAALWLALAFAALQLVAGFARRDGLSDLAAPAAYTSAVFTSVVLAVLVAVFVQIDLSVEAVIAAADRTLPLAYRVAAAGSPLVVASGLLALAGVVAGLRDAAPPVLARLGVAAVVVDALLLVGGIFARADPAPTAGNGLAIVQQVPLLGLAVPLAVAAAVALLAGIAVWSRDGVRRGAWAAAGLLAAAATVRAWAGWHAAGDFAAFDPLALVWPGAGAALVGAVAGGARSDAAAVATAAVLALSGTLDGAVAEVALAPGTRLTPVAGANWTAIEAVLAAGMRPQLRDYPTPPARATIAATRRDATGGIAVTLRTTPSGLKLRTATRPYLLLTWLGGGFAVAACAIAAWRRPA